jgi:hypothetical protein
MLNIVLNIVHICSKPSDVSDCELARMFFMLFKSIEMPRSNLPLNEVKWRGLLMRLPWGSRERSSRLSCRTCTRALLQKTEDAC